MADLPELAADKPDVLPGPARRQGADDFAQAVADWVLAVHSDADDTARTLAVIVEGAVDLITGSDGAGVLVMGHREQLESQAACGSLPPAVLAVQNKAGHGPCFDALTQTTTIRIDDMRTDTRWPRFVAAAAGLGVLSMLCIPLTVSGRVFGSLSLVATSARAFGPEAERLGGIFATHASVALAGAQFHQGIGAAVLSRDVIGQAKGILMERHRLTADAAFDMLVRSSQYNNMKLRDVCDRLTATGELPAVSS